MLEIIFISPGCTGGIQPKEITKGVTVQRENTKRLLIGTMGRSLRNALGQ